MKKDESDSTVDVKRRQDIINESLKERLNVFKSDSQSWVDDLNQFTGLTQALVDAANQIVVLPELIGAIPPAEFELMYYRQQDESAVAALLNENRLREFQ